MSNTLYSTDHVPCYNCGCYVRKIDVTIVTKGRAKRYYCPHCQNELYRRRYSK